MGAELFGAGAGLWNAVGVVVIFLVIFLTVGGHDYERSEPMPSIEACYSRAVEVWASVEREHPDAEGIGIGCSKHIGDPA